MIAYWETFRRLASVGLPAKTQPAASPVLFTLASRLALGSAPISEAARVTQVPTSRRLHRVDSAFLPWAPLPSLRRHAAAGAHFHELAPAHPLRRTYTPTTSSSSSILVGLGIKEQGLIEFYGIVDGNPLFL